MARVNATSLDCSATEVPPRRQATPGVGGDRVNEGQRDG